MKGQGHISAARLSVVYPDTMRKDRKALAGGQIPLVLFATDAFKDDLAGQLATAEPGPWHVHIPHALRGNFAIAGEDWRPDSPHLFLEQLIAEQRNARGKWEKPHGGVRNEATDLMVGAHVIAHLHGLSRIDWARPPTWAAQWADNSLIAPLDTAAVSTADTPAKLGSQPATPTPAPATSALPPPPSASVLSSLRERIARFNAGA
jgi:phage terminase large subunit GpA-like protein